MGIPRLSVRLTTKTPGTNPLSAAFATVALMDTVVSLSAVPEILKLTVASPSFLLVFGRLIVNAPVLVGEAPDSAAVASVAAILTLAVAARACGTIEFPHKLRPNTKRVNGALQRLG